MISTIRLYHASGYNSRLRPRESVTFKLMNMTITDDLVEAFLKCPTKCFLRSRGEAGAGNAYAAWVRTNDEVFRIEGNKRLVAAVAPDKCATGTQAMGTLKPAQWHLCMDFAVQSQNLQCSCHAVEQIPSTGRGRTAQFVPTRFVFRNKLNRDDKLLLAFDARVLSEVLRREVGLGKIVYGENYATLKVKTPALASDVRKLTDKIGTLLASPSPPELVLNRHCAECAFRKITKCLYDLRFSRSGVTGWVVKYQFQVFWCPTCRAFTPWPKEFWDRTTYGRNLAAFSIFEMIELCFSQRSVTQTLNRLFAFQMDEIVVRRLKERGAEYYRETRKNILTEMVEGNVIHADETRIRLHGKAAYVWLFSTFRQVVYLYSETREGNLVQSTLDGFKGVLVSDFYAAYDSIPCPQQKCMLHLMRDLNDTVLDNPYDESVKYIATAFGELLRGIVNTVDRYGLKSLFLRKHLVDVARFYKRISKVEDLSAAASKWKARFDKDREKLFTFLTRDGVSWNNNNAEHAIKSVCQAPPHHRRSLDAERN